MNERRITLGVIAVIAATASLEATAGTLKVVNTYTNQDVWITTYQSGRTFKLQAFCVPQGKTVTMDHEQYGVNGFNVRAEVVGGNSQCKQHPVVCDTQMGLEGRGNTQYRNPGEGVYIHPHARIAGKCYISYREKPDVHRAVVENTFTDKAVWVTFYDYLHQGVGTKIVESDCIAPKQTKTYYNDWYEGGAYKVRAEVMTGTNGKGGDCKGTKVCDTDANPLQMAGTMDNPKASKVHQCFIDWK